MARSEVASAASDYDWDQVRDSEIERVAAQIGCSLKTARDLYDRAHAAGPVSEEAADLRDLEPNEASGMILEATDPAEAAFESRGMSQKAGIRPMQYFKPNFPGASTTHARF